MSVKKSADWHLLFGLLALQQGFVSNDELASAFAQWTSNKSVPLDELLVAAGALEQSTCSILNHLVEIHVQRHGGDAQQSLMTLCGSDISGVKKELERIDDSELRRSIDSLPQSDAFDTVAIRGAINK